LEKTKKSNKHWDEMQGKIKKDKKKITKSQFSSEN
jgi:hypothetical protein